MLQGWDNTKNNGKQIGSLISIENSDITGIFIDGSRQDIKISVLVVSVTSDNSLKVHKVKDYIARKLKALAKENYRDLGYTGSFKRGCKIKLNRLDGLSVDDVCNVYDWLIEKPYR